MLRTAHMFMSSSFLLTGWCLLRHEPSLMPPYMFFSVNFLFCFFSWKKVEEKNPVRHSQFPSSTNIKNNSEVLFEFMMAPEINTQVKKNFIAVCNGIHNKNRAIIFKLFLGEIQLKKIFFRDDAPFRVSSSLSTASSFLVVFHLCWWYSLWLILMLSCESQGTQFWCKVQRLQQNGFNNGDFDEKWFDCDVAQVNCAPFMLLLFHSFFIMRHKIKVWVRDSHPPIFLKVHLSLRELSHHSSR